MGRAKYALRWGGGTMIDVVAAALGQVCRKVVVVGGEPQTSLPSVADLRSGQGPLGGIEALLASGLDSQYLVCPCDLPLVTGSLLERLTGGEAASAAVFRVEGEPGFRPLPARVPVQALEAVRAHLDRGQRAVHELLRGLRPQEVILPAADAHQLADLNTPQEYQAALRLQAETGRKGARHLFPGSRLS
jgi:molybdenum cofactor guanylyltransferase